MVLHYGAWIALPIGLCMWSKWSVPSIARLTEHVHISMGHACVIKHAEVLTETELHVQPITGENNL